MQVNYTWGKTMAYMYGDITYAVPTFIQDFFDVKSNRGRPPTDIQHSLVGSFVYDIPLFAGSRRLLKNTLGGWEGSGVFRAQVRYSALGVAAAVGPVEADEADAVTHRLVDALEVGHLLLARRAPRRPHVHDERGAAVVGEAHGAVAAEPLVGPVGQGRALDFGKVPPGGWPGCWRTASGFWLLVPVLPVLRWPPPPPCDQCWTGHEHLGGAATMPAATLPVRVGRDGRPEGRCGRPPLGLSGRRGRRDRSGHLM
jgi:hypothetical protein